MSPCERTQTYLDGQLAGEEHASAEAHLKACARCQALTEGWRLFSGAYQADTAALMTAPTAEQTRRLVRLAQTTPERPTRRWPALAWAGAALAALVVVVATWGLQAPEPLRAVAVAADGREVPLQGDTLEAPSSMGVALHLGADQLGVAPHSRLKLLARDRKTVRIELERGSVAAAVQHRTADQSFSIQSGGFVVRVIGTRFRVTRTEGGIRVEVAEGRVRVTPAVGPSYDVPQGRSLSLDGSGSNEEAFLEADFPELHPELPPVVAADAGQAASDAGAPEEPEPEDLEDAAPAPRRTISRSDLGRWRRAAAGGRRCKEVLPEVRRAVRDDPRQGEAWRVLADCARLTGDHQEALRAYRREIAVASPKEADRARVILSGLLFRLGRHAEAEQTLREFLSRPQLPPLEAAARVTLARALLSQARPAEARAELQRVTGRLPSTPAAIEALELLKTLDAPR